MKSQLHQQVSHLSDDHVSSLILWTLSDGRAYTAIELADYAGIPSQDITGFIDNLKQAGLIVPENHRHHYFRLADDAAMKAVKSVLQPDLGDKQKRYSDDDELSDLTYCRSCHGHLAGEVGVKIADKMQQRKMLVRQRKGEKYEFLLTDKGEAFFSDLNIDTDYLRGKGGIFAKACLDFSERKHHLGGKLGVAFLKNMLDFGWIQRRGNSRVHELTGAGKRALQRSLGVNF